MLLKYSNIRRKQFFSLLHSHAAIGDTQTFR